MDGRNNENEKIKPQNAGQGVTGESSELTEFEKTLAAEVSEVLGEPEQDGAEGSSPDTAPAGKKKNWFQRIPLWIRIPVISLLAVVLVLGFTVNAMLDRMIVKFDGERVEEEFEEDENNGLDEMDPEDVKWETTDTVRQEEGVINILLVGEEAIGSGSSRGRTDTIMIASVNFDQKSIKLTSLMRDMYVQIPGYQDNKLNAAYGSGGIPLLEETLELNLDIEIDGAVLVNFDGFEKIIDSLGGVELTLTSDEAYYLNTTNYVSNPAYRNLVAGKQTLNGNQALGYMRIRYVRSADNTTDDFGRTSRHRTLLTAVFDKYKTKSLPELLGVVNELLPYIETDISKTDIISYATSIVSMGLGELETFRIPQDNMYDPVYIRSMAVLVPHLPENVAALHEFIYGPEDASAGGAVTGGAVTGAATGGSVDGAGAQELTGSDAGAEVYSEGSGT